MMQTRAVESLTGVDNTPQSLLMFAGKNVHGLYDFLLNYRLVSGISLFIYLLVLGKEGKKLKYLIL